ncbi:MAG: hypothetical protein ACRCVW_06525 [Brevinema sp.]
MKALSRSHEHDKLFRCIFIFDPETGKSNKESLRIESYGIRK